MDDTSLDEYAFDFLDEIHPDAKRLIKQYLAAAVDHSGVYSNALDVSVTRDGQFDYFLGGRGGAGPLQNHQKLPVNLVEPLLYRQILGPKTNPQWRNSVHSFTDKAFKWHRQFGGPSADEVRKRIGRYSEQYIGSNRLPPLYSVEEVAAVIQVPTERARKETHMLLGAGLLYAVYSAMSGHEFGALALSEPEGIRWAAAGFPPIGMLSSLTANVSVALHVEVQTVLQEARAADIPPQVLEQFEARLHRVEEEITKEEGEGNFEKVRDLIDTANTSKDLLGSVIPFLVKHWDKIQTFADAAGNALT